MNFKVYSIYDLGSEEFTPPFFARTDKVAVRNLNSSVKDVDKSLRKDYVLCQLGTFNSENGKIVGFDQVIVVAAYAEDFDQFSESVIAGYASVIHDLIGRDCIIKTKEDVDNDQ